MTRNEFVNYIVKLVKDYRKTATKEPDFFDSITIAQAIHETGYGTSELYTDFNNAFGYKAKVVNGVPEWDGKVAENYKSDEEIDGVVHKKVESDFRWYDSVEESVADHANMMTRLNGRYLSTYRKALDAKTPKEQARALTGSYAGDSRYAKKLIEVMDEWNLYQYDTKNQKESVQMTKLTREQAFAKLGLTFKKQPLPLTKTYGRINKKRGTVIHQTGSPGKGLDAQWMADYQKRMSSASNREEKSWNYQVDDKEAIMSFDHDVATWQASDGNGPGNTAHISIEACINSDGDYNKTIDNLAKTMAVIAYVESFKDIESTTGRHYDFARDKKWCPAQIMNGKNGFTYAKVKAMAQAHLNTLNGAKATSDANPQGLNTSKIPAYQAPKLAFDRLDKGAKVKFRDPWNWYDDGKKEFIHSKKHDELLGTKFTIDEIKDIAPIGYSKVAYKSKEHNSWILEQDIIEARKSWEVVKVDAGLKDEGKVTKELEEGQFWIVDTLYQVTEIK